MGSTNQWVPSPQPSAATSSAQQDGIIYASAARGAATYTSDPLYNPACKGVRIYCDITNANGGSVTIQVQTQDPASKNWVNLLTGVSPAWNAAQTKTLTIYPALTAVVGAATTNAIANEVMSTVWRIVVTVGAATVTFSVGAEYLM
jgi:hypothetical protein